MSELEQEIKAVAAEVKEEVVEVVNEVKQEVVKVETEVVAEVKKLVQELTAEEKLAIRQVENSYLKAQIEIQRLSQITQKAQQDFTKTVEELTRKYLISPVEFVFDNVDLIFKRK